MKTLPRKVSHLALVLAVLSAFTTPAEARRTLGTPIVVVVEVKEVVSGS
jgi:hypothetical protein